MLAEPDRYIAATLAPPPARPALAAIAAFAAELARIPTTVREPALGEIRLQWWRDTLAASRSATPDQRTGNPVADALVEAIGRHGLSADLLEAMIDARHSDLSGGLPADDAALAAYLDATEGHAFRLALAVVGAPEAMTARIAAPAGLAYGLSRSLGRLPMLLHNGGAPLTADRLRKAGVEMDALAGTPPLPRVAAAVAQIVADLAAIAQAALAEARAGIRQLPRPMRAAVLPVAMVEPYFRSQSGLPHLDRMAGVSPLARVVRIGLARLTGRP